MLHRLALCRLLLLLSVQSSYKKDSLSWDNYMDLRYGFLKEDGNDMTKSSDRIEFNSKLGYNTGTGWNYAALVNFKSQFAPGYNYPRTPNDTYISKFLAPAYINIALGMDYKNEFLTLIISPATGKFTMLVTMLYLQPVNLALILVKSSGPNLGEALDLELKKKL